MALCHNPLIHVSSPLHLPSPLLLRAGPVGPWRDTRALARLYLQLDLLRHTLKGTY